MERTLESTVFDCEVRQRLEEQQGGGGGGGVLGLPESPEQPGQELGLPGPLLGQAPGRQERSLRGFVALLGAGPRGV